MGKENKPSKEVMQMYALKEYESRNVARACHNCVRWDRGSQKCTVSKKMTSSFMFCPSHEFETERIANAALESLDKQQKQADKVENLLALAITTANTTTCFLADLEKRIRQIYNHENNKQMRTQLRKEMDMSDTMKKAFVDIEKLLEKVDQRYRFYVQPYLMKWFTVDGKFDEHQADGHLNNAMEFARLLMKFTMKCIGNGKNCDAVFALLDSMTNDYDYALDDNDAEHYRLKGYE